MTMKKPHSDAIPAEMKTLRQWVCWDAVPRDGKVSKLPIDPQTGWGAKTNDPSTWTTFDEARKAASQHTGIGFVLEAPYVGIDIDHVDQDIEAFKKGKTDNIIYEFIHKLKSYAEYSPSGMGIHIICKGSLPDGGRRRKNVEMYQGGRFFTVTGNSASEYTEVVECTEAIKLLHEKYIAAASRVPTTGILTAASMHLSDSEILDKARRAKNGSAFQDYYSGEWDKHANSRSEADLSFCNMLAFWTGRDIAQMDRLFRQSGLMREKWDRPTAGSTYGRKTLEKAANECREIYTPQEQFAIHIQEAQGLEKVYLLNDTGNAERLRDLFQDRLRYCYPSDTWHYYDGRVWVCDKKGVIRTLGDEVVEHLRHSRQIYLANSEDEQDAEKKFYKHLNYSWSNRGQLAMIDKAKHYMPILPEDMDSHKMLFNTPNGTIDLCTNTIHKADAKQYLSKITYYPYDEKADCPQWLSFLGDIFKHNEEIIAYIQKAVGYSLTGLIDEHCVFFCYGDGLNGKSTFLNILSELLGDYAVNVQPETIMVQLSNQNGPTPEIARLKGARLVTCAEPSEGMRINEGLLKQLTGGDKVTARFLHKDNFEFRPEFKLWMATNHKPVIRGTDDGIWRRVVLIDFAAKIPADKVDTKLPEKLRKELPGILQWALQGCLLWQKEGLGKPTMIKEATKEYRNEMDILSMWLDDCCVIEDLAREKITDLYQCYASWAREGNEYVMSNRRFGREMAKRFEKVKGTGGMRYSVGVRLKDEAKPFQVDFG